MRIGHLPSNISVRSALLLASLLSACGDDAPGEVTTTQPSVVPTDGMSPMATGPMGSGGALPAVTPTDTTMAGGGMTAAPATTPVGVPSGGAGPVVTATGGASPVGTGGAGVSGAFGGGGAAGAPIGGMGAGGMGGFGGAAPDEAPELLSETGLFTSRGADGELVLAEGVREFEPKYWLWSDGSDKRRYIFLPEGTQIDTSDPDHWVFPVGTKLWKSFIVGEEQRLVETRLIERVGEAENDWRYATYYWREADGTDAGKMGYKDLLINAAGTPHDIPNGNMCERCHGALKDRILGFSALQLNHDGEGLTLESLQAEGLLTDPISLDVGFPGDEQTQAALGYLHANCGNCHNDTAGVPVENIPEPQLLLRGLVGDLTFEDTGFFKTALNHETTASTEFPVAYRVAGGDLSQSALHLRMTLRLIEDQMPPIGTEETDDTALTMLEDWIATLPPPAAAQ